MVSHSHRPVVFGVDEAGRGPVLGSMFAAAVAVDDPAALPDGMDDSKNLSPERREALAAAIRADESISVGVAEITTERIDDPESDMNTLTVAAHVEAISRVAADENGNCSRGIVDACDTSEARFARRVAAGVEERGGIEGAVEIEAEHGADETHAIVGAASIVAKVERDAHVARLAEKHGAVGSGYPSDPNTREFLREYVEANGELPGCARASWRTSKDVLAAREQSGLDQF
ncbi:MULTISPECIES: ribonuclease HII [unclassified Haladaptatus]|uniref:ribonuclease HII n=1 Tax=unclassified Haladaptatus TaxID=2622732 RepID=UPI00209BE2B3|nr:MULTISPECIES: ribonuclease HII [unclassified Haladaptatus]MCO8243255.1 ribonuclease HII [Haladaptatus sp. AB643]MCO8252966.1 ribonuclease HII [Haladaptatus sp. AB618]